MLLTPFREPGALYWKSIMIARRFVLVLLFCVVTETSYNLFWTTLTCLLALFHHLRVKPFKHNWTNNLESISLLLLVVLGFINLYKSVLVEAEVLAPTDSFKVIQWLEIIIFGLFPASVCLLFSFEIISLFARLLHVCYGSLFRCMFSGFSFSVIRYSGPPTVTYSHYKVNPMTDNVCGKTTLESFQKHNGDGNFVHDVAVAVAVSCIIHSVNDIYTLYEVLQIPEEMKCVNGFKVLGLTALSVLLKRFAYPCRYLDIMPRFALSVPQLSMISNLAMNFVYDRWGRLPQTFEQEWLSPANLQQYAQTIHDHGAPLPNC
jgi:hypothetical protein